ncbi:hypothetical protein [Enterococcus sp. AZ109]|uniref:hypothetical protein n=1 Tax=Enterococcus sp. AZ109 TaxID=2774634 RepID=UPI003F258270
MKKGIPLLIIILLLLQGTATSAWAEETATSTTSSTMEESSSLHDSEEPTSSLETSTESIETPSTINPTEASTSVPSTAESSESLSENESTPSTAQRALGSGTEESPYLVTTYQELADVLTTPLASGQTTQYIQLQNDIVYNTTSINIRKSTVIDGNGHAFLYAGRSFGTAHFSTYANNINVTYKNLTFGNDTYPNSTYYGILYIQNTNINFTVENVAYNIQIGSQPFWGNNGAGNTLTFKGKNTFYSSGSYYGGEFVEGYRQTIFAAGSDTTVYNDSPDATAVFWGASQVVTVENQASLSIESSKPYLFYDNATLNVQEQGNFSYKTIYGSKSPSSNATLCTGALTMNFGKDAIGHFTTDVNSFSGNSPTINLNSPDYVVFDATDAAKQVLSNMRPVFRRTDADSFTYGIEYLTAGGQNIYQPRINPNTSTTVSSGNIGNGYSVAYARYPSLTNSSATPETGTGISSLIAQIEEVTPVTTSSRNVQYKLAKNALYTGADITTKDAQASIEQAGVEQGVVESADLTLPENSGNTGAATQHVFQQLLAGNYYLYARLDDQRIPGYRLNSPWQETTAEVPRFIQVQFPDGLHFTSPIPGKFGKDQNLAAYSMQNTGNVPVAVDLTKVTSDPSSTQNISLVKQFTTQKQELILSLIAETSDSKQAITLGPLTENEPVEGDAVFLNSFWESDAQAQLYLSGNYSGPMIGPQAVNYRFTFAVSSLN